ncbi:hypothetical protein [Megasphaera sp. AM44-1BH]|nr:hypothetical protein [Megasphaera sp. AM44-1BH]
MSLKEKTSAAGLRSGDIAGTIRSGTVIMDRIGCRECYLRPARCFV